MVPTESGLKPFSKSSTRFRDLGCILASATSFFFSLFFLRKKHCAQLYWKKIVFFFFTGRGYGVDSRTGEIG